MAIYKLKAEKRENLKKSHTNQLRKGGMVPGNYYYHKAEPIALAVDKKELMAAIKTNTHIFELSMGKKKLKTVIKTIQWHPVSDEAIHIDFLGVNEAEAVEVSIKVVCEGLAVGVKEHGGLLSQTVWHLDVKCLLKHIPENIVIDVTDLGMGDSIGVKDLNIENVEFVDSPEKSIVSVIIPKGVTSDDEGVEEDEEAIEEETTEE